MVICSSLYKFEHGSISWIVEGPMKSPLSLKNYWQLKIIRGGVTIFFSDVAMKSFLCCSKLLPSHQLLDKAF